MQWRGRRQSNNIEDRRSGGVKKVGGVSIFGLIIAIILWQVFGISPETTLGVAQQIQGQATTAPLMKPLIWQSPKHLLPQFWQILKMFGRQFLPNQDTTISHQVWFCLAVLSNLPAGQPLQPVVHFIALLTKKYT